MNTICISGRMTKDPDSKNVGEHTVVSFGIAVDGYGKNPQTSFFDVECWDKTAEFVGEYLTKGSPVFITGRLQQDRWEKDGKKYSKDKIVASQVDSPKSKDVVKDDNLDGGQIDLSQIPF